MNVNEKNLTAALTPKDAMTVHPNMFALQIKYKNMTDIFVPSNHNFNDKEKFKPFYQ